MRSDAGIAAGRDRGAAVVFLALLACATSCAVHSRTDALRWAGVWIGEEGEEEPIEERDLIRGPRRPDGFAFDEHVRCDFVPSNDGRYRLGGATSKFRCALAPGDVVKVKYGPVYLDEAARNRVGGKRNGEVFAEVAGTRLLWALGFPADAVYPVKVTCRGCPADPWSHAASRAGSSASYTMYPAVIERRFPGKRVSSRGRDGWRFGELDGSAASPAQRDALRLLMGMIQHSDSKANNQRLVCIGACAGDSPRNRYLAMVHDLGATFGAGRLRREKNARAKMSFAGWSSARIWRSADTCRLEINHAPTGTLRDGTPISEDGRRFLSGLLSRLSRRQIVDLFKAARVGLTGERIGGTGGGRDRLVTAEDWADVFERKRDEIAHHARCEES